MRYVLLYNIERWSRAEVFPCYKNFVKCRLKLSLKDIFYHRLFYKHRNNSLDIHYLIRKSDLTKSMQTVYFKLFFVQSSTRVYLLVYDRTDPTKGSVFFLDFTESPTNICHQQ